MKAVIMAGGKGTRLDPLTREIPKPLVSILGEPVINYTVRLLARYGVKETAVTLQHMPEAVVDSLNRDFPASEFYCFLEEEPLGTAGGVKNAERFLDDTFIVMSGDALTDLNIEKMLSFHRANNADITVAAKSVADVSQYGVICRDSLGRVFDFKEKPSPEECDSDLISGGIYIIEPRVLKFIPKNQKYDFARELFPDMLERGMRLFAYPMEEYWCDVGSIYTYFQANMDLLEQVQGNGQDKLQIINYKLQNIPHSSFLTPNSTESGGGHFVSDSGPWKKVYLGRGCEISADAVIENSVICGGTVVGAGARLERCVILEGACVEAGEYLADAIVGRDFNIALNAAAELAEPRSAQVEKIIPFQAANI